MSLFEALEALRAAEQAVLRELETTYPNGCKVVYRLRGGKDAHRYPEQTGKIVGYVGGSEGRVRIQLAPGRWSERGERGIITTIPVAKIIRRAP